MKTIHQLAKAARRIPKIGRKALKKLMETRKGKKLSPSGAAHYRAVLAGAAHATKLLHEELRDRNIGATAFRCALPLKKQREILAANESSTAQKLLAGQTLAA